MRQYYMNIKKNYRNFELCNTTLKTTEKILPCMHTSRLPGLDERFSKFFKDSAEVLVLFLASLSIKQSLIPSQGKTAKQKPLFEKGTKSDPTLN